MKKIVVKLRKLKKGDIVLTNNDHWIEITSIEFGPLRAFITYKDGSEEAVEYHDEPYTAIRKGKAV